MWSVLPLWIILNAYAFLMDAIVGVSGCCAWLLWEGGHPVWGGLLGGAACIFAFIAIRLHLSYPQKRRTYEVLLKRNREALHRSSFREFMGAPCYRLVVRTVMNHTGHGKEYEALYRNYWGDGVACCTPMPAKVIVFQSPEEGRKWLNGQREED